MRIFFISNSTPASITWERKSCANYHANYRIFSSQYQVMIAHPLNLFPPAQKMLKRKKKVPKPLVQAISALSGAEGGIRTPARFYPPTPLAGEPLIATWVLLHGCKFRINLQLSEIKVAERVGFEPTALASHRFSRPAP